MYSGKAKAKRALVPIGCVASYPSDFFVRPAAVPLALSLLELDTDGGVLFDEPLRYREGEQAAERRKPIRARVRPQFSKQPDDTFSLQQVKTLVAMRATKAFENAADLLLAARGQFLKCRRCIIA